MTELGTIMIFECAEQPGGTHIIEDHYIEEVHRSRSRTNPSATASSASGW